ncbi:hypothetical protein ACFV08_06230 [Streptomyces fradiae]|uniref:hypothetical protein n=1 Tax=Streptomyces TaxID=1883 RepID=UPI002F419A98
MASPVARVGNAWSPRTRGWSRFLIFSRMGRTASTPWPAGAQTSDSSTASTVRIFGVSAEVSMPTSAKPSTLDRLLAVWILLAMGFEAGAGAAESRSALVQQPEVRRVLNDPGETPADRWGFVDFR